MVKPRPCRVCRRWFRPSPRVGDRQHVCGSPACQRELHRRNCADWHRRNPGLEKETRFEERLVEADPAKQQRLADPLEAIDWPFAKEVCRRLQEPPPGSHAAHAPAVAGHGS